MKDSRLKRGSYIMLLCLLITIPVIAVNVLAGFLPSGISKIDLTQNRTYTLDAQTVAILKALDQKVSVYHIAQSSNEDEGIKTMLKKYAENSSFIEIKTVDPVVNPNFVGQYSAVNLNENSLIVVSDKRSRAIDYTKIYSMEKEESLQLYQITGEYYADTFCLENELTGAINYVITDRLPTVKLITGHGESEPDKTLLNSLDRDNLSVESVHLLKDGLAENTDLVIINSPSNDISSEELSILREYLSGGGALMLLTDVNDSGMSFTNLEALSKDFGVTAADGAVYETDSSDYYSSNYYIFPSLETHGITQSIIEQNGVVLLLGAHPMSVEAASGVNQTTLLESSSRSFAMTDLGDSPQRKDSDPDGPFPVAVLCEREDGAKFIRISSSTVTMTDADRLSAGGDSAFFLNCAEYLAGKTDTITVRTSPINGDTLAIPDLSRFLWTGFFCVVISLALLIAATVVWYRRKKN